MDLVAEFPPIVLISETGEMTTVDGRAAAEYECARRNLEATSERETVAINLVTAAQMLCNEIPDEWSMLDPDYNGPLGAQMPHQLAVKIAQYTHGTLVAIQAFVDSRRSV